MMKKTLCFWMALLLAMVLTGQALGQAQSLPPDEVFETARKALVLLSNRQFDAAAQRLGSLVSASALRKEIDANCKWLYSTYVQDEIAVSWISSGHLYLAVPFEQPADGYVDALVFSLNENFEFTGAKHFVWSDISQSFAESAQVKWHLPYTPEYSIFVD